MTEKGKEYPFGTPQEQALTCDKHRSVPIDVICEDCEEFICSKCVKEDHKDQDWDTIHTAVTVKTRGPLKVLNKAAREFIQQLDEKVHMVNEKMKENEESYNAEVSRSRTHLNTMVKKINETGKQHEKQLRDSLVNKNACLNKVRLSVEEKKETVLHHVKSLQENHGTMTDIVLLKTHRDMIKLMSTEDDCIEKCAFSLKYDSKNSDEKLLESMMGRIIDFDSDEISVNNCKTRSFQWSDLFSAYKQGLLHGIFGYFYLTFLFLYYGLSALPNTYLLPIPSDEFSKSMFIQTCTDFMFFSLACMLVNVFDAILL